ncbi:MAG TPA: cation-translocating P-type ATPase [Candidatus Angelobacter sp.]|jgi:heavy metal translocating P-type ATPase|nr:cation-translocating P-type ATPase [Candidatus Angelobacter sp.]
MKPTIEVQSDQHPEPAIPTANHHHDDHHEHGPDHEHGFEIADLLRVLFVALAAAAVWFRWYEPFASFSLIGIAATLIGGYPIFREAVESILERRMTMELSMTIALLAALAIREFFTALIITLFVLVAEILEGLTLSRGRKAIEDLVSLLPQTAEVYRNGKLIEAPLSEIHAGEHVLVRPGTRVPVDGWVFQGSSFVDQSAITGEVVPAEKAPGAVVYAGTINQTGVMEVTVTNIGADTTFGKIIEAVERAENSRAPIQRIADQLAGYLVYFALGAAVLTFLFTHNMRSTISVIIVAGACGIAAGTPLAVLGAIGRSAKLGVIVKGGLYIEQLGRIDTVVLDKTGTLTFGTPQVVEVKPASGITEDELLRIAAIAERNSEHPLAKAIVEHVQEKMGVIPGPEKFQYEPGRGIIAVAEGSTICVGNPDYLAENGIALPRPVLQHGMTEVLVAHKRQFIGSIVIDDQLRTEAVQAVRQLKSMSIQTVLLTGDSVAAAKRIGRELDLDDSVAQLLPEEKLKHIVALQEFKRKVAMVGDGINDAPALAQADVGIAMGSGTDVARESADVVLIGNNLLKLAETLRTARRCRAIIFQNFYGTLIVDAVGMLLAAFGFLTPLLAAFIHVASELAFILNSTRLLPSRRPGEHGGSQVALHAAVSRS